MHKLHSLKEKFMRELESFADKSSYTPNDVETVRNLISSINKICEYTDAEEGKEEYSGRMSHTYPMYAYDEGSYARGRRYARRDAMGRYSREGAYSREDGYSRDKDMMSKLYEIMEDAPEHKKMDIKRLIDKLENM